MLFCMHVPWVCTHVYFFACLFLCAHACAFFCVHVVLCMRIHFCACISACTHSLARVVWGMHTCVSAHASLHTHHCSKTEDCITLLTAFFRPPFNHFNFNCCAGTAMPMCRTTRE